MPRPRCTRELHIRASSIYMPVRSIRVRRRLLSMRARHPRPTSGSYVRSRSRMTRVAPHALHRVVPREPFSCGVPTRSCRARRWVVMYAIHSGCCVSCTYAFEHTHTTPRDSARARHISALCVARPSRDGFSRRVMGRTAVTVRYLSSRRVSVPLYGCVRARACVRACVT